MSDIFTGIIDCHAKEARGLKEAFAGGIKALIHKATEGRDFKDKGFLAAIREARALGMLVGAYHFGSNSCPGAQQADFFLSVVAPVLEPDLLLVLDWETNPNAAAGTMHLDNARAFVTRVYEKTGRWPVFYSYISMLRSQVIDPKDPVGNCPLWCAKYGNGEPTPPKAWKKLDLWQYSDYANGPSDTAKYPRITPGMGPTDRSAFKGSYEELKTWWLSCGKPA